MTGLRLHAMDSDLMLADRVVIFTDASHERNRHTCNASHGTGAYVISTNADAYKVFADAKQKYDSLLGESQTRAEQAARKVVKDWIDRCNGEVVREIGPGTQSTDMEVKTMVKALQD